MAWFTAPTFTDGTVLVAADLNTLASNAANGTVGVANGGTGLTAGTNGGVPYFSSTSAMGSSALLTRYAVLVGGGAGAGPSALAALGTSGWVLKSQGAGANPIFAAAAPTTQAVPANLLATTYQHTGATPRFVSVSVGETGGAAAAAHFQALTDAASPPTTVVAETTCSDETDDGVLGFWVLPNNYYRVNQDSGGGTGVVRRWAEWS